MLIFKYYKNGATRNRTRAHCVQSSRSTPELWPLSNVFIKVYNILQKDFLFKFYIPMSRILTSEESFVVDKFSSVKIKNVEDVKQVNLVTKKNKFFVESPVVYEIENTDSFLILGEPKQVIDINYLKRLYVEQLKSSKK